MSASSAQDVLAFLLRLSHWLVITYAWLLIARAFLDLLVLWNSRLKERLLPLETILLSITDPVLDPLRRLLRPLTPPWLDLSPFLAILACLGLDYLIAFLSSRL